jgi:MoaA/NifB/PqqE/SkfB family radical SAM enzyme
VFARRELPRLLRKALAEPAYALRSLRQRLRCARSWRRDDGRAAPPETISLFLTRRCDLRCRMCNQWGPTGSFRELDADTLGRDLPRQTARRLFDEVRVARPAITLFGGEPLLHGDFRGIVADAKAAGLRVNVVTNGTQLAEAAADLVRLGLDELIVSLDGPREVHDAVRGVPGTFDRAADGLRRVRAAQRERRARRPRINITSVIVEGAFEHLHELLPLCDEVRADSITVHHRTFAGRVACGQRDALLAREFGPDCFTWNNFVVDEPPNIEPGRVLAVLRRMRAARSRTLVTVYPNLTDDEVRNWYRNLDFAPRSRPARCLAPWTTAYVLPDATIRPFHAAGLVADTLHESTFSDVWNNSIYRHFRRVLKAHGRFPACSRCTELYRF